MASALRAEGKYATPNQINKLNSYGYSVSGCPSERSSSTFFVYGPLLMVTGPFLVPYSAAKIYLENRQEAAKLRQHVDLTFAWTNPNNLPTHIREFFDLRTPELERLGFQFDGVYWMKPQHGDYYGALFINRSGTTIASLIHIYDDYHCSFSSIFESGRCLETAPVEQTSKRESRFLDNPKYTVVFVPGQTTRSSYQQHRDKLVAIYEATGDRSLVFGNRSRETNKLNHKEHKEHKALEFESLFSLVEDFFDFCLLEPQRQ